MHGVWSLSFPCKSHEGLSSYFNFIHRDCNPFVSPCWWSLAKKHCTTLFYFCSETWSCGWQLQSGPRPLHSFHSNSLFVYTIVSGEDLFTNCFPAKQSFKRTKPWASVSLRDLTESRVFQMGKPNFSRWKFEGKAVLDDSNTDVNWYQLNRMLQ